MYLARRLQDIRAQTGDTIIMTLDWDEAFDRAAHPKLKETLESMNVLAKLRNVVVGFYSDRKSYVIHGQTVSTSKTEAAGIRQKCRFGDICVCW